MRLVCPNCSAQYEIDGSMIPEEGRDVQCSNCGHTWFELPAPAAAALEAGADPEENSDTIIEDEFDAPPPYDLDDDESFEDDIASDGPEPEPERQKSLPPDFLSREDFESEKVKDDSPFSDWDDEPKTVDTAPDAPEASDSAAEEIETSEADMVEADTSDDVSEDDDIEDEAPVAAATAVPRQRRPADAAALDILREEAEREMSQRRAAPSGSIETQTDLGLEDIRNRRTPSRALRARMAHLGEDMPEEDHPAEVSEPAPAPVSAAPRDDGYEEPRRDLLPDIDEINSTLKAGARGSGDAEVVKRSGFRFGFLTILFLTIAAIFAYAQAPAIARALPQTETAMISYVDWANGLRDWVDGLIGNAAN